MSANQAKECPVCNKPANLLSMDPLDRMLRCKCDRCGEFQITEEAVDSLQTSAMLPQLFKLSAYLRERDIAKQPIITIVSSRQSIAKVQGAAIDVESVVASFPLNVSDRLDRVLRNIQRLSPYPGARFRLSLDDGYPVFFSENPESCFFLAQTLEGFGWLKSDNTMGHVGGVLTVKGWNRIAELERGKSGKDSRQAFVAMWFESLLDKAYREGMQKAIEAAGYSAVRVDLKEHNEKICDTIVAEIRKSRFMVADFTGHRGGVYFEAGFAKGLGMEVIWTCREDEIEKTHFDTRQYNHIVWKDEKDLFEKLRRRIEATISG